jgi:hypothetical protein
MYTAAKSGLLRSYVNALIPSRDAEFDGWLANLTSYVDTHTCRKVTALKQRNTDWHAVYTSMLGQQPGVDTEAKNDAQKAAEAFARQFVAQYLTFDPVTNKDRTDMNLHNWDTTHSPIGKPTTRALITDLKGLKGFQTEIRFQGKAPPGSHSIPYGMNGCLLNTAGKTDYALLKETSLMTPLPFR